MNPIGKALWYIESHFAQEVTLEEVASIAGVSRYYLTRAFAATTGYSIMRYVRARRLSQAARALSDGAPDILTVALEAGYGSHEAFTRAFRDQFGVTPQMIRRRRHLNGITLVEPLRMDISANVSVEPPRFENRPAMVFAGLAEQH